MARSIKLTKARLNAAVVAGEALAAGDAVCIKASDGKVYKAKADNNNLMPCVGFVARAYKTDQPVEIVTDGIVFDSDASYTIGKAIFVTNTAGRVSTSPGTSVQQVGWAVTSKSFNIDIKNVTAALEAGAINQASFIADGVIPPSKTTTELKTKMVCSPVLDIDSGSSNNIDVALFVPRRNITVTGARLVVTHENCASSIGGGSIRIGTSINGQQIVASTALTALNNKTIGQYADLTVVNGSVNVNADTMIVLRHTGVDPTKAGQYFVMLEYYERDAS